MSEKSIWEVINISDPITFIAEDFKYAVGAAFLLGHGQYGLREVTGSDNKLEMPILVFSGLGTIDNWLRESFPALELPEKDAFDKFFSTLDKFELANVLRTTQVCSPEERESYQKALTAIDDPEKLQDYVKWWKEKRRSSMNDISGRAWRIAERLEVLAREEK